MMAQASQQLVQPPMASTIDNLTQNGLESRFDKTIHFAVISLNPVNMW